MPHSLILGMTESGKTTLGKKLAAKYRQNGTQVIVLDPMSDPEWNADFQTSDPEEFLEMFWGSRSCAVFIDESGDAVGKYNDAMNQTATRGRHWGHNVHFLCQRGAQISATVRNNCARLFLFKSGLRDRLLHAEEWDCDELKKSLDLGECYAVGRDGRAKRLKIF